MNKNLSKGEVELDKEATCAKMHKFLARVKL